jgi:hypothetical protein
VGFLVESKAPTAALMVPATAVAIGVLLAVVSIENERSVPYRYGELLALLVYLTWLLHEVPGTNPVVFLGERFTTCNEVLTCT